MPRRVLIIAALLAGAACGGRTRSQASPVPDASLDSDVDASSPPEAAIDAPLEASLQDGGGTLDASSPEAGQGLCGVGCHTADDCQSSCPTGFLTSYCCDTAAGTCFVAPDGPYCPLHEVPDGSSVNGCMDTGCPSGQMCVLYLGPDPPSIPIPSCFALPAACAGDPTCPCLAEAGVCGPDGGGYHPTCDGIDGGAELSCFGP